MGNLSHGEYLSRCNEFERKIRKYEYLLPLAIFFAVFFERLAEESIFERQTFYWVLFSASCIWALLLFAWFKKAVEDLNFFRGVYSHGKFLE